MNNTTNNELIEFAKDQCEIFPEDSYMGKYLRETIKMLEDELTLLKKIKQAREEIKNLAELSSYITKTQMIHFNRKVLDILDKLIEEVGQ